MDKSSDQPPLEINLDFRRQQIAVGIVADLELAPETDGVCRSASCRGRGSRARARDVWFWPPPAPRAPQRSPPAFPCRRNRRPCAGFAPRRDYRQAEQARDDVLHFGRMLRRGHHEHRAVLARLRARRLHFEIKMLLPGDEKFAFQNLRASFSTPFERHRAG